MKELPATRLARLKLWGWKEIRSEKHAHQLLRRELKQMANNQQRRKHVVCDLRRVLTIKPGSWYKFVGTHQILLVRELLEKRPQTDVPETGKQS